MKNSLIDTVISFAMPEMNVVDENSVSNIATDRLHEWMLHPCEPYFVREAPAIEFAAEPNWIGVTSEFEHGVPGIRRVIFNNPATIIQWADGTKTVVKCMNGDCFDEYNGFMAAVCKKMFGSSSAVKKIVEKYSVQETVDHVDV